MDLYEALKAGTSSDELEKAFYKELDAALDKIEEERQERIREEETAKKIAEAAAANQEHLKKCRFRVADAIVDYVSTLLNDDTMINDYDIYEECTEALEDLLIELEKNILKEEPKKQEKPVNKKIKPEPISINYDLDQEIIDAFLKALK